MVRKEVLELVEKELTNAEAQDIIQAASLESLNEVKVPGSMSAGIAQQRAALEVQLDLNKIYIAKLQAKVAEIKA